MARHKKTAGQSMFGFLVGTGALLLVGLLGVGALATPAFAQDSQVAVEAALAEAEGQIHAVELGSNTIVIDGIRFKVALDVNVEIRGSYGAFSMLTPGMKVLYEYRIYAEDELEIVDIEQLPDNTVLEQS
jgi:hypothetical protein